MVTGCTAQGNHALVVDVLDSSSIPVSNASTFTSTSVIKFTTFSMCFGTKMAYSPATGVSRGLRSVEATGLGWPARCHEQPALQALRDGVAVSATARAPGPCPSQRAPLKIPYESHRNYSAGRE